MDRRGQPGRRCAERSVRSLRHARAVGARPVPAGHPAGVEPRPVGAAEPCRPAGRDARCAHRRGAPAVQLAARLRPQLRRRAGQGAGPAPRPGVRDREHVPGQDGRPLVRPVHAGLGPDRDRLRRVHPRPVALRGVADRRAGHGRQDGRRSAARAPGRRHRRGPGRAPGARPRQSAVRRAAALTLGAGLHRRGRPRGLHRKATSRPAREADLRESLDFARRHLAPADSATPAVTRA